MRFKGLKFASNLVSQPKDVAAKKKSTINDLNRTSFVIVSKERQLTNPVGTVGWDEYFYNFLTWMRVIKLQNTQKALFHIYENPQEETILDHILPSLSDNPHIQEYIHCNANQHNFLNAGRTEINLSLNLAGYHFPATINRTASVEFHQNRDGSLTIVEKFEIPKKMRDIKGKWYTAKTPSLGIVTLCSRLSLVKESISHQITHFYIEPLDTEVFSQIFSHKGLAHFSPFIQKPIETAQNEDDWVEISCIDGTWLTMQMKAITDSCLSLSLAAPMQLLQTPCQDEAFKKQPLRLE